MSYIKPMGDGPITHPSEVEDPPIVPPTRVSCDALPPDSPWKRPGQVCAPADGQPWFDVIKDMFFPDTKDEIPSEPNQQPATSSPPWLLLVAGGGLAYYLLTKKRR